MIYHHHIRPFLASEKGSFLANQLVVSGSALVTNLLLAQSLGLVGYGYFSSLVLCQLFLLSIQRAVGSDIYQAVWPSLPTAARKTYTDSLLQLQVAWLIGLMAVSGFIYSVFAKIFARYDTDFLLVSLVVTSLFLLQDFLRKVLQAQQQASRALLLDALTNGAQLVLLLVFRLWGDVSLVTALWIIGATFLLSVVLGLIWLKPRRLWQIVDTELVWHYHRQQGGWPVLSGLRQWLAGNFFVLAVGWWLGPAALGALRLTQYIFGLLNVVLQALENYVIPRAVQVAGSSETLIAHLRGVLLKSLLGLFPVLLLTLCAEPLLACVGGDQYRSLTYVMYGLSGSYVLVVCSYPVRIMLNINQLSKHYFVGYALAAMFSLTTTLWFITTYGLVGVLTGLFLTQAILLIYWLLVLQHNSVFVWKSFTLS